MRDVQNKMWIIEDQAHLYLNYQCIQQIALKRVILSREPTNNANG